MKNDIKLVKLVKFCPFCKERQELLLTPKQFQKYLRYKSGKDTRPIQKIFFELDKEQREFLQTGICYQCWEQL